MEKEILQGCYLFVWIILLFFFLRFVAWTRPIVWVYFVDLLSSFVFKVELRYSSIVFLFSLSLITLVVGWFGELYVGSDKQKPLFWLVLIGFVIGMGILITSFDFLLLIFGWEILGVTSYLLVAGYLSPLSSNGAIKTVLFNRIGDVFFVLALRLLTLKSSWVFMLVVLLFAMCKSAQFPFSAWLPAAMAAPTPVSALVHSSTLVTAGLWVLLKIEVGGLFMFLLGSSTMLIGALCALAERDLKKVVAFSTLSQLGLLIIVIAGFSFQLGFFHLITHAFFKSVLFISVGLLILSSSHNQQGTFMRRRRLGIISLAWIRLLSMRGVLFFAGFCSKHAIFSSATRGVSRIIYLFVLTLGRRMTCLYSVRLASSLTKTRKLTLATPQQVMLLSSCLLGGAVIGKFLPFDVEFNRNAIGIFSFLFLFWGWWSWRLLSERDFVSRIFFSSIVTPSTSLVTVCPSFLDGTFFSLRNLFLGLTDADLAKLIGLLVLSRIVVALFLYCCSLNRMSDLHSEGGFPIMSILCD